MGKSIARILPIEPSEDETEEPVEPIQELGQVKGWSISSSSSGSSAPAAVVEGSPASAAASAVGTEQAAASEEEKNASHSDSGSEDFDSGDEKPGVQLAEIGNYDDRWGGGKTEDLDDIDQEVKRRKPRKRLPEPSLDKVRDEDRVFEAVLDMSRGRHAGIGVMPTRRKKFLEVEVILDPGAAALWNSEHPDRVIHKGCRILKIHGVEDDVYEMVNKSYERNMEMPITVQVPTPMGEA